MTDGNSPHDNLPHLRQYQDDDLIYRAVPNATWLDEDGQPTIDNYLRRNIDKDGLSVASSVEECERRFRKPIHGMMEVRVGDIRALGLEVRENRVGHSVIEDKDTKIPFARKEPLRAIKLAARLLSISRPAEGWPRPAN